MKICWDNLEGVKLTKSGTFRKGEAVYIYKEACANCGEPYLAQRRHTIGSFCSRSCANCGENNSFFGKTHTIENRKKIAERSYWNGVKPGLTLYRVRKNVLGLYENIRKQENTEALEVQCTYCGCWFAPTRIAVDGRLSAINNLSRGECRLYCSENCKQACPTYGRQKYPKGFKHTTSREVSPYLRKMVLERDSWTCQICGKTIAECQLHVHHMDPVAQNPMFQNDMDSCITLCKGCHKMVHSRIGCRYIDLVCKKIG